VYSSVSLWTKDGRKSSLKAALVVSRLQVVCKWRQSILVISFGLAIGGRVVGLCIVE